MKEVGGSVGRWGSGRLHHLGTGVVQHVVRRRRETHQRIGDLRLDITSYYIISYYMILFLYIDIVPGNCGSLQ
jgi:hypothetical protein